MVCGCGEWTDFSGPAGALSETLRISLCRHGVWKAFDFTRSAKIDERTDQGLGNMRQIFDLFGNLVALLWIWEEIVFRVNAIGAISFVIHS